MMETCLVSGTYDVGDISVHWGDHAVMQQNKNLARLLRKQRNVVSQGLCKILIRVYINKESGKIDRTCPLKPRVALRKASSSQER